MTDTPHLLLADDEETFLLTTSELLKENGFACNCARNADEVLDAVGCIRFDALILDIKMPGNADLQLLDKLQTLPHGKGLPVIIVTGWPSVDTTLKSFRSPSVIEYLTKPFELTQLTEAIHRAVARKQALHAFQTTRHAVQDWAERLGTLERAVTETKAPGAKGNVAASCEQYLLQMQLMFLGMTDGLRHVVKVLGREEPGASADVCALMNCPTRRTYEALLDDTVQTLEKTKSAFKSKDLGDLRKRLETTLKGPQKPPAASPTP